MSQPILPFEKVFQEHKQAVFCLIFKTLGNQQDAEDVAMRVFLKAHKSYAGFRGESSVSSWLYRIAVNAVRDHLRGAARRKKWFGFIQSLDWTPAETQEDAAPAPADYAPDSEPTADRLLEREELVGKVRGAVQGLPDIYREAVWLVSFQGLSYEEAAAALEVSVNSLGVRLARAKEMLRKTLEKESG